MTLKKEDHRKKEDRQKAGRSVPPEKRTFYVNRELARKAGREGGKKSQELQRLKREGKTDGEK